MPWFNSTDLSSYMPQALDFLIVASGNARPSLGGVKSEMMSTYDLFSNHVREGLPRVIYLSSGAVYGECIEKRSESDPTNPSTEYGLAKLAVEKAFLSLCGKNFCSLRIGNVIDWDSPYGVLQAMSKALTQHRIDFYGNPTDCRDYVSIQDLTFAISKIVESEVFPNILNVGSGVEVQLRELAFILNDRFNGEIEICWQEIGVGQLKETKLDISKLKSTFGVYPKNPREIFTEFLNRGNS
jgi:UDP-glucose 4-epimerase